MASICCVFWRRETNVKVLETALPGVKLLEPRVFNDDRGFFLESWNAHAFAAAGIDANFVQDNHSRSAKGVLRGLHYQIQSPQGKLVRVVAGVVGGSRRALPMLSWAWGKAPTFSTNARLLFGAI